MSKLSEMSAPKSDQLNATDLASGPIDITITKFSIVSGEQPLSLHADAIPGRPWKPCKTMMRWMAEAWKTDDPGDIVGKTVRLYCDPDVHFGGIKTGGIRISHLSHIDKEMHLQEGNRRQYKTLKVKVVKPLKADVTPVKAVEKPVESKSPPASSDAFDFAAFESVVKLGLLVAENAEETTAWWNSLLNQRKAAGAADKERAIAIATKVKEKIAALEAGDSSKEELF